jgi:4-hydroxybenzoate polyprenyltransferase
MMDKPQNPLCVDLDGTLVRGNTLAEAVLVKVRREPISLPRLVLALLQGQDRLWRELSGVELKVDRLPYQESVLNYVREQRETGRKVVLVTGAGPTVAHGIAKHLGLFDEVYCTEDGRHLVGDEKRAELTRRYGAKGYDYIGDSAADIPVWKDADKAIFAGRDSTLPDRLRGGGIEALRLDIQPPSRWKALWKACRTYQWAKNVLVLAPLVLGHRWSDKQRCLAGLIGFAAFSLVSSSVYLINDVLDAEADRAHESKRDRPVANGSLSIQLALSFALLAMASGLALAWMVHMSAALLLVGYLVATLAYSFRLKEVPIVDVMLLGCFYTLRIFFGGEMMSIRISPWTFSFSMFIFLSLAFMKRYSELHMKSETDEQMLERRGYHRGDASTLSSLASACGVAAVVVVGLYVQAPDVQSLYRSPGYLWLTCPILLTWICRHVLLAGRGLVRGDPVLFALRDRASLVVAAMVAVVWALAL